jgi:hypothetical protein
MENTERKQNSYFSSTISISQNLRNCLWNNVHGKVLWRVGPLLGNDSVNKPAIHERNTRTGVARGAFYVVRKYPLVRATDVFSVLWSDPRLYKEKPTIIDSSSYPCGGGVEYLHRDPASRRRRQKGKSQIWDSKIWSQVPGDSDPRKTALTSASSTYKRQTQPLVREGAPQEQDRNCHTSNQDLVVSPRWVPYSKTDWPTDRRS